MRRGEPMAHNDVQFCTNIIYNEKEFVFLIVERKERATQVEIYTVNCQTHLKNLDQVLSHQQQLSQQQISQQQLSQQQLSQQRLPLN
mgnify:FL=1